MRRRLFFMLPDAAAARTVLDELLLARIDERHIHFLGQRDTLPPDLPEASFLQKTDFLHALRTGALVGAAAGIAASTFVWFYPPAYLVPNPAVIIVAGLVGAALGAWFSSLVGSSVPNTRTSLGVPGPEPTMMLSAVVPSIWAAVTLTPPRVARSNAAKRAICALNAGLPSLALPE